MRLQEPSIYIIIIIIILYIYIYVNKEKPRAGEIESRWNLQI